MYSCEVGRLSSAIARTSRLTGFKVRAFLHQSRDPMKILSTYQNMSATEANRESAAPT